MRRKLIRTYMSKTIRCSRNCIPLTIASQNRYLCCQLCCHNEPYDPVNSPVSLTQIARNRKEPHTNHERHIREDIYLPRAVPSRKSSKVLQLECSVDEAKGTHQHSNPVRIQSQASERDRSRVHQGEKAVVGHVGEGDEEVIQICH